MVFFADSAALPNCLVISESLICSLAASIALSFSSTPFCGGGGKWREREREVGGGGGWKGKGRKGEKSKGERKTWK